MPVVNPFVNSIFSGTEQSEEEAIAFSMEASKRPFVTPMDHVQISGADYDRFERVVFHGPRGPILSDLTLWHQPLAYFPGSNLLRQTLPGPCAIFGVLQSQIVLTIFSTESDVDLEQALHDSVLTVLARVSPTFTFCTGFDRSAKTCDFETTQSRDAALAFLIQHNYLNHEWAALHLTLGLIFAAKTSPSEPYIEADQYAALVLVMLLLNGADSEARRMRTSVKHKPTSESKS
jgi:hypothetical protein